VRIRLWSAALPWLYHLSLISARGLETDMSKYIQHHVIPVDGLTHNLELVGDPGATLVVRGAVQPRMSFWAPYNSDGEVRTRQFKVIKDDDELPIRTYRWWGTAMLEDAAYHLVELRRQPQ
jgi:hypothetical protein